jgi:hypothetical protein
MMPCKIRGCTKKCNQSSLRGPRKNKKEGIKIDIAKAKDDEHAINGVIEAQGNKEAVKNALKDFMAIAEDGDSANDNLDNCLSGCSDKWGTGSSANNCRANCHANRANHAWSSMDQNSSRKKKYSRSDCHYGHHDDAADVNKGAVANAF